MVAATLAFALALTGGLSLQLGVNASPAAADGVTPELTAVSAEFVETTEYSGVYVDFNEVGVTDAKDVELRLNRADGTTYSVHALDPVLNAVNASADAYSTGGTVITLGSRTSSSWDPQVGNWNSASKLADSNPVTVVITLGNGEVIEQSIAEKTSIRNPGIEDNIYPVVPQLTAVSADFVERAGYSGVYVGFEEVGVTDATDVELRLNRADGTTYSVHAKPSVLSAVNASADAYRTGGTVITLGSRTSDSWDPQVGTWNSASKLADSNPVTVVITLGNGEVIEKSIAEKTSILKGIEDNIYPVVLPLGLTNSYAEYKNDAGYKGITVQIESTGFTDAEQVIVQVDRSQGGPVQKISQPDAAFLSTINGDLSKEIRTTAPIVIQPGTYDENASSSWIKPGAVWTSATVPTSVTITVKRTSGSDVVKTIPLSAPPAGILPEPGATPVVTVPSQQPAGTPFVVDVPAGEVTNIGLGTTTGGSTLVSANLVINTPTGVSVNIPANTTVTGPATWDGVITAPYVVEDVTVPASAGKQATVALAIKVGSDAGQISFDKAVKVTLPGQAGNSAGFIDHNDTFHAITAECGESPENLSTGECWMNEGDDLVIWTTHFTTFVAYTITATGGGGALAVTGGAADLTPALVAVGIMMMLGLGLILAGRLRRQGARR
jgi:hypothetical protein